MYKLVFVVLVCAIGILNAIPLESENRNSENSLEQLITNSVNKEPERGLILFCF